MGYVIDQLRSVANQKRARYLFGVISVGAGFWLIFQLAIGRTVAPRTLVFSAAILDVLAIIGALGLTARRLWKSLKRRKLSGSLRRPVHRDKFTKYQLLPIFRLVILILFAGPAVGLMRLIGYQEASWFMAVWRVVDGAIQLTWAHGLERRVQSAVLRG